MRLDGVRVLVVDDEADGRRLIGKVLAEVGASIVAVASVQEAMANDRQPLGSVQNSSARPRRT